jgi:adenosylcobinamide-phosphate synthase
LNYVLEIAASPAIQPWLVMLCVLILERIIQFPTRVDPMAFVSFLGERMAHKVLPKGKVPSQQHIISGGLGAFLIVVPTLLILIIFREFVYYPALFDGLILYISIQFSRHTARFFQIMRALNSGKKSLAKELLQPMVLRDTAPLSEIGISKAAIEALTLRYHYQVGVTLFWYILVGPFAALTYRACYELHQSWNPKLQKYQHFGLVVTKVCSFFQWLPVRLLAMLTVVSSRGLKIFHYMSTLKISKSFRESKGAILIRPTHYVLNANLSGALFYNGIKYRRPKYIGRGEPKSAFMPNAVSVINRTTITFVAILLPLCILTHTFFSLI